jgi:hypothetical protein
VNDDKLTHGPPFPFELLVPLVAHAPQGVAESSLDDFLTTRWALSVKGALAVTCPACLEPSVAQVDCEVLPVLRRADGVLVAGLIRDRDPDSPATPVLRCPMCFGKSFLRWEQMLPLLQGVGL